MTDSPAWIQEVPPSPREGIPLVSAGARGSLTEDHPDKCNQPCHGLPAPNMA